MIRAFPSCVRVALVLLMLGAPAHAATVYVSPAGHDGNPGTLAAPVATLGRALSLAGAGDTILLRRGTYAITRSLLILQPGLTLRSYPGEWARITGGMTATEHYTSVLVVYASQVTVRDLEIEGGPYYGIKLDDYYGPQRGIRILNVYVHHTGRDGIKGQSADDVTIEESRIGFTGMRDPGNAEGIDLMGSVGARVRGNYVHDIATTGIFVKAGTRNAIVEGNRVERTGHAGILLGSESDAAFMRDGARHEALDSLARNNVVVEARLAGLGSIAGDNIRFLNNTVVNAAAGGQAVFRAAPNAYGTPTRNVELKNNVFVLAPGSPRPMVHFYDYSGPITSDSNIWFSADDRYQFWREFSTGGVNYWSGLPQWRQGMNADWNSSATDPGLESATPHRPLAASPAVDTGETLPDVPSDYSGTLRPQGSAYDIGAHEYEPPRPVNMPPAVTLTSPLNGSTFTAPATIAVAASASDSDGTIAKVDFYVGSTLIGSDATSPYHASWSSVPAGSYTLTARATDNSGTVTTSAAVTITVTVPAAALPVPWQSQDIGAVGAAGSASAANGTLTVRGAGADVWGAADAFHYVWQRVSGDFDVVARVASVEYMHAWTKAGVMIRERLTLDSPHAFMLVSPGKGIAFQRRVAAGGLSTHTGVAGAPPAWVKLERRGGTVRALYSADGTSWTALGSETFTFGSEVHVGLAVSSHDTTRAAASSFDSVAVKTVTAAPSPSLPSGWQAQDIGAVGTAGNASANLGTFSLKGAGADVWGSADAFHFAWQRLSGDGDVVARVTSVEYVHAWVKAGVMIRERLTADSPHAFVLVSPGKGLAFQRRIATGGLSTHTTGGAGTAPAWVKLERRAGTITAFVSADGSNWTLIGSDTFTMGAEAYVGLAVSSHDTTRAAAAVFEQVSVRSAAATQPAPDAREIVRHAADATRLAGSWRLVPDSTAASGLRAWNPDAGTAKIRTAEAAPRDFVELTFSAEVGRAYRLWIRGRAERDTWSNDSVHVQFSGTVDAQGSPVYRIGTTSSAEYNLESCNGCGLSGWGWEDNGWGVNVLGSPIYFAVTGPQTIRIQTREDGLSFDQVVLSSNTYFTTAPGATKNDATILPKR